MKLKGVSRAMRARRASQRSGSVQAPPSAFAALPPGVLERIESLEQLRALEAGWRIAVALAPSAFPPGVDTPEDLERAERILLELTRDARND